MKNNAPQHTAVGLEQEIALLKTINRNVNDALQKAIMFGDFNLHLSDTKESSLDTILDIAMKRSAQLIRFTDGGFFLVDETSADFVIKSVRPNDARNVLVAEVEHLIKMKLFHWVLKRKKPVFFKSSHGKKQLLLHVLATTTRVRGMFICYLDEEYQKIDDHRLTLFSLVMYNCANAVQLYELHKWNRGVTQKLEENVQSLAQSQGELESHRSKLEGLVAVRTESLAASNIKLQQEINERRQAEVALAEAQKGLEQRVRQRTRELEQAQSQLMIHEKLASVGQLATGIAHELYNPLNFIRTNMACLEEYLVDFVTILRLYDNLAENCLRQALLPELTQGIASQKQRIKYDNISEETLKIFKENSNGFERINEVVNILRNFTSAGFHDQIDHFDLNLAIGETLMLSRNITEHGITIETDLADLPPLSGQSVLIKQALLNVLINSIQAINSRLHETEGQITIRTFADSRHVGCVIEDNGPGIPEQEQIRIFDPFFTTHEPGSGKGLGLSTTYDIIVNKHGGKISCVCPPQGGTIITLLLPLAKPPQGGRDD